LATRTELIVLLSMPRSGTHFLRSVIATGTGIAVLDEPFNPDLHGRSYRFEDVLRAEIADNPGWRFDGPTADALLDRYFDRLAAEGHGRSVLVDIKDDQLRCLDWPATLTTGVPRILRHVLKAGYRIIRLERRNLLAQYASVSRAMATGEWVRQGPAKGTGPVLTLDYGAARHHMVETAATARKVNTWIAGQPHRLSLAYETLIERDRLAADARDELAAFLGMPISEPPAPMPSKLAPPLEALVANLSEIRSRLAAEKLDWLLGPHGDGKSVIAVPAGAK
jgi:hypothetical protein